MVAKEDLPAIAAGGQHNLRFDIRCRQGRAIGLAKAHAGEVAQRALGFRIGAARREPCRGPHFPPPGLATPPAIALEIMRDRGQRISAIIPNIAPAIAVKIHCQAFKIARHELRLTHRARPGTLHALRTRVPVIQDAQGRDQFIAEIGRAAAFPGQRRQSLHHAKAARIAAVIRLHAPDRDNH